MTDSGHRSKRSGRISMTTMTLFTGVVVLLILLQPAAAVPPERSLLAVKEGTEKGPEEIRDTAGEAQGDVGHVREVRSSPQGPIISAGLDDEGMVSAVVSAGLDDEGMVSAVVSAGLDDEGMVSAVVSAGLDDEGMVYLDYVVSLSAIMPSCLCVRYCRRRRCRGRRARRRCRVRHYCCRHHCRFGTF
ncbi:uncharacterized protein LOC118423638 [Branchiostoma floridae]|uniref:Uncharacterized protein LOC118423638 n=1 Tax=Branchiostoma floridae TaxID=7739 RepID=A0A9J7LT72_BRAFL|nr:uncharacterized protein LOC118423638 [Branchiostoma floridae]XP_035687764.1 uncharacterized protein LOC118423638 [Branchiostoma floridae]